LGTKIYSKVRSLSWLSFFLSSQQKVNMSLDMDGSIGPFFQSGNDLIL
jgi:hypothetical protein